MRINGYLQSESAFPDPVTPPAFLHLHQWSTELPKLPQTGGRRRERERERGREETLNMFGNPRTEVNGDVLLLLDLRIPLIPGKEAGCKGFLMSRRSRMSGSI